MYTRNFHIMEIFLIMWHFFATQIKLAQRVKIQILGIPEAKWANSYEILGFIQTRSCPNSMAPQNSGISTRLHPPPAGYCFIYRRHGDYFGNLALAKRGNKKPHYSESFPLPSNKFSCALQIIQNR